MAWRRRLRAKKQRSMNALTVTIISSAHVIFIDDQAGTNYYWTYQGIDFKAKQRQKIAIAYSEAAFKPSQLSLLPRLLIRPW